MNVGYLAYADDEGFLYIVDHKKDMMVSAVMTSTRRGSKASGRASAVADAAVTGSPDESWGESAKRFGKGVEEHFEGTKFSTTSHQMEEIMKKSCRCALMVVMVLCLAFGAAGLAAAADERLAIGTASTGGTWYPLGGGVANMINNHVKGYYAAAHPSGASLENIRAIQKKQDALALSMPDTAFQAFNGLEAFTGKPVKELRGLMSTYPIDIQFFAPAGGKIKSIKDLKGKKVAVGAPGSGTEAMARYVLNVYGLTYNDIDEQFLSATETTQGIKDGNIDAGIVTLGTPAPTLMDLATQRNILFLDIEPEVAEKINKEFPAYFPTTIPAGTYKGQDKPHHTLSWMGIFVVNQDMSEKLAYDILKAVFDNKEELDKIHAQFKNIDLENAVKGMPIPFHAGAEKFFKEKGLIK